MTELNVLLPPLARLRAATASPVLNEWLVRGDCQADATAGREAVLRNAFEFISPRLPFAALTRSLDSGDVAGANWLFADPSHVAVDAVAVRMLACATLDLTADDGDELARALRPLFGDAGFLLETSASRWYLRCPIGTRLPRFDPPEDVLGDNLMQHLPTGDNQKQWQHLLNEAQIILHNHPVNASRQQRGQMPANSVWFWGVGELPEWVRTRFTRVLSDDNTVRALARSAGVASHDLTNVDISGRHANTATLLDLAAYREIESLEKDWLIPIDAALKGRVFSSAQFCFASGERVSVKPWHRWRFWRRARR